MKNFLLLAFLLAAIVIPHSAVAQRIETCSSPEARAFDFWIGDWHIQQKILQEDGTWLRFEATTSVSATLDGCAIIEHWEGTVQFFWDGMQAPEPMKGLSVRAYDPEADRWYIHWMDTRTPRFDGPYAGGFDEGRGEFFREWETPQGRRLGRIVFSDITPDSVDWELAISNDEGQSWSALWIMEMVRVGD
jgi:hypothetical protein